MCKCLRLTRSKTTPLSKQMRYKHSYVIPLLGILLFTFSNSASAQDMLCQQELGQANAMYSTGRFDEAISRIDACLEKEGLTDMERRTAYRLKGLCFIGKGIEVDAKTSVRRLMELFPNYQPDPIQDPPDFVAMVNEVRAEINRDLAAEETQVDEVPPSDEAPPVTQPSDDPVQEPVAEVAKKKKRGSGRFLLIGAGVAAVAAGAVLLTSGGDGGGGGGGGVEISEPPPLPN